MVAKEGRRVVDKLDVIIVSSSEHGASKEHNTGGSARDELQDRLLERDGTDDGNGRESSTRRTTLSGSTLSS